MKALSRIRAVLRRGPLENSPGVMRLQELVIDISAKQVSICGKAVKLGPLEYRLLKFFVAHQNRVYSRDELLTYVWGQTAYVDERTVDVLIRRLRKQLREFHYDRFVQTVHGFGYRFSDVTHK